MVDVYAVATLQAGEETFETQFAALLDGLTISSLVKIKVIHQGSLQKGVVIYLTPE